jgi:hypothetical protein
VLEQPIEQPVLKKRKREYSLLSPKNGVAQEKESVAGYLIGRKFHTIRQAEKLLADNPAKANAILDDAVPAKRHADGSVTTAAQLLTP